MFHLFFKKYFLRTSYVPGSVLGTETQRSKNEMTSVLHKPQLSGRLSYSEIPVPCKVSLGEPLERTFIKMSGFGKPK